MIKSDEYGNIYIYDASMNMWIKRGIINSPELVNANSDGLINPRIVRKLELMEEYNYNKNQFSIQLGDNTDPINYYYFRSPNNLIKITHYDDKLRFEVDRNILDHEIIKLFRIKGPQGLKGPTGDKGRDGIQCKAEEFFTGTIVETGIYIYKEVATPIDTEVSLRIYDLGENQLAEIWITLDGDTTIKSGEENINSLDLSFNNNILEGIINLKTSLDVKFKARQRGKKGKKGKDGLRYLEVQTKTITDDLIRSKTAIINVRKSPSNNDIYYYSDEVLKENIASKIAADFVFPSENDIYPAVQLDNSAAKKIITHRLNNKKLEDPIYNLPEWIPNSNCRNFNDLDFDTEFDGIILKNDFKIDSCVQPFTFKANGQCACQVVDPITVPKIMDKSSDSYETLPQSGFTLDSLYESDENTYTKDFSGTIDIYKQPILFSGSKKIYIKIESSETNISSQIILDRPSSVTCGISDYTEYTKLPININFNISSDKFYYNTNGTKIWRIDLFYIIIKINTGKIKNSNTYTLTIGVENA